MKFIIFSLCACFLSAADNSSDHIFEKNGEINLKLLMEKLDKPHQDAIILAIARGMEYVTMTEYINEAILVNGLKDKR